MGDARGGDLRPRRPAVPAGRCAGAAQARADRPARHAEGADPDRWWRPEADAGAGRPLRDEFNLPFKPLADVVTQFARVRAACEAVDRDPAELTYSVAHTVCVGENDAELARRAAATGRELDDLRENGIAGTPAQVVEQLGELAAAGVQRVYLQVLDLADLEHVALLGRDVRPAVADA